MTRRGHHKPHILIGSIKTLLQFFLYKMRGVNLLINVSLKRPENGNEKCAHHKDEKIEGYTEPEIIGECVTTWSVHHEIRLVPDGGCKTRACSETDGHNERLGVNAQRGGG